MFQIKDPALKKLILLHLNDLQEEGDQVLDELLAGGVDADLLGCPSASCRAGFLGRRPNEPAGHQGGDRRFGHVSLLPPGGLDPERP